LCNISAPVNQGDISANNGELSATTKQKTKTMDINKAHYKMGHMGEVALRKLPNHHNIKAPGKFENCISCMKWKAQNKKVSKVKANPAKYPGERLHMNASGPLPLPMCRKEYWLKIRDEYSGYSWEYFMSEKSSTTTILKRQLEWMKASGMRVKTVRCDNAKEQMSPLKDMCWENGVLVEYVAPYTPQQNGKVERQFPMVQLQC
jgi:transposase InsO family protein